MCRGSTLTPAFLLSLSLPRLPHPPPLISFPSRLCQGLEWMMSRLRVRWCPPAVDREGALVVSVSSAPNTNLNWGTALVDPPVLIPEEMDGVLPGFYIGEYDNLFCSFWTHNQIIGDFRTTLDTMTLETLDVAAARFSFQLNRGHQSVGPGIRTTTTTAAVWVHSGLAVLPDWLWPFSWPSLCIQPSILTWCLQQNVQVGTEGDRNVQKGG